MADKTDAENWKKGQDMEAEGFDLHARPAVHLHGKRESASHAHVKLALVRAIQRKGRKWDTEVQCPNGRVDVLDFGPDDGKPVVYEVETGVTAKRRREKADQYAGGTPVRDVLVIDPADAPDDVTKLDEWADKQVVG